MLMAHKSPCICMKCNHYCENFTITNFNLNVQFIMHFDNTALVINDNATQTILFPILHLLTRELFRDQNQV